MARRDYEDDPGAPRANSLVPAASAVVVDEDGRVLLQRRTDNGMWARPTGGTLRASDESYEVAWFAPEATDTLPMVPSIRKRISDWRAAQGPVVR